MRLATHSCLTGEVVERDMTPEEEAAHAVAVTPPPPTAEQLREQSFIDDTERQSVLTQLRTATPAQIDAYIDANVTNIASARVMLKRILKVLAVHVRR